MYPPKIVLCFVLLLVASPTKSQRNSTNIDERSDNSTMQYDSLVQNEKMQYEPNVNATKNDCKNNDSVLYESCRHTIKSHESENNQMNMKSHMNSTKIIDFMLQEINENLTKSEESENVSFTPDEIYGNPTSDEIYGNSTPDEIYGNPTSDEIYGNSTPDEIYGNSTSDEIYGNSTSDEIYGNSTSNETYGNSTLKEIYENSNTDDYNNITIVPYQACDDVTCVHLCCSFGEKLTVRGKCKAGESNYSFPRMHGNEQEKKLNKLYFTVHDPCLSQGFGRGLLTPDRYLFLVNGSLYQGPGNLILPTFYCLAVLLRDTYDVIICTNKIKTPIYVSACLLISLPFLLLTFIIYSILPELQNMHGYTLRAHVASLFITYAIMYVGQQVSELTEWKYCVPLAYIFNFTFLSSFFWLNISCFDIWWTIRGLRSYQPSIRRDKKKFMYSLYGWGIPFILSVICVIMDYAPGLPKHFIRPEMCRSFFWYSENLAKTVYFYIPMAATIAGNVCFFIATMLTILYKNILTAQQMKDSESERHNENKQRFKMYLKLFTVMGISWVMELTAWWVTLDFVPWYVWIPFNIINASQGVIIFIIFVCTKKIKQLLLKQYGGRNCGPFCKIPMSDSVAHTITSSTSSISASRSVSGMRMREINSSN